MWATQNETKTQLLMTHLLAIRRRWGSSIDSSKTAAAARLHSAQCAGRQNVYNFPPAQFYKYLRVWPPKVQSLWAARTVYIYRLQPTIIFRLHNAQSERKMITLVHWQVKCDLFTDKKIITKCRRHMYFNLETRTEFCLSFLPINLFKGKCPNCMLHIRWNSLVKHWYATDTPMLGQ